jgi:hypothetical protein
MIIRTSEEKKAIHFRHINVDYFGLVDDLTHGAHIARFIRQNVMQGIPLKVFTESSSGLHYLNIAHNDQTIMFFTDIFIRYQVNDIFYRHQCIVDLPHYNTFLYYAKELIKNFTFCYYLINGDDTYSRIHQKLDSNEFIFKELVVNSADNEFGISINYTENKVSLDFMNYDFAIDMHISNQNELLNFSYTAYNPVTKKKQTNASYNFHEFICRINKRIYNSMVEDRLHIPVKEFTIQHREIVKMFDI